MVDASAAPAEVRVALDRLRDDAPDVHDRLVAHEVAVTAFVAVTAASRSLTRAVLGDVETSTAAVDRLANLDHRPPPPDGDDADRDALARWKRLELLRIAARDLVGLDELEDVGGNLALLADDVLQGAHRIVDAAGLSTIGMGKLGGRELNYASDVDVLFVGDGGGARDTVARAVLDVARACFRVDANLRPEGRDGPLVRTLDSYEAYWDRWAETWEFQALLKSRPVAGDVGLGDAFAAAAARRVWSRPFGVDDLRAVRSMKARSEGEIARRGLSEREVKRGPGGIRDVEFSVQLLQLVHGRHDEALRTPTTLTALAELAAAGFVAAEDADALATAYRYLRAVEHRLQLVEEQQVHAVPADANGRDRLARVMGYRDAPEGTAAAQMDADLKAHQAVARSIHERLFFRPLLEAFTSEVATGLQGEALEARLSAFGFADATRTRAALRELTTGLTRSSRLMQQLMPLLLGWLSEAPDPDLGLLGLRRLASGRHRADQLTVAFRESPEVARRLCVLLGTSRLLADVLERHPAEVAALGRDDTMQPRSRDQLLTRARASTGWREEASSRRQTLHRMTQVERFRIEARDVLGEADVETTGRSVTALAEAVLDAAVEMVAPDVPLAVIGMGRFGGGELSYASDLDVLFVHDEEHVSGAAAAERAAEAVLRLVKGATPAEGLFLVDADLRPEGKDGLLARSLGGYREYYERWALTWERQALVRARPVAGDRSLGERFCEVIEPFVWAPLSTEEEREIRRMKARVEKERIPAGDDPEFHLKLGRGSLSDVEWLAQLLQLRHGVRSPGTVAALRALRAARILAADDEEVLAEAYRFCERTRNRWYLVKGAPGDALPSKADDLSRLARSLDTSGPALRETYRRVTRRARAVFERLFYATG